jgi:hypothetical protein
MSNCTVHRRHLPPPIRSREAAELVLNLVTDHGREAVIALACLDRLRRPLTMFVVEGGEASAGDVRRALDVLLDSIREVTTPLQAVILAASRPEGPVGVAADDLESWPVFQEACTDAGLTLVDYFVLADGTIETVSDVLHDPPPW